MGKKRIIIKILIILLVIIILLILLNINKKTQDDYFEDIIPEEEISEEQERKTMITLYFKNKITGDLEKETRIIDVKNLMESPYKKLLELLIEGTKNENLETTIPKETKINNIKIEGETVYIDFSKEFIENHEDGLENENKTIYSIVNTLTELNEVTFVKI